MTTARKYLKSNLILITSHKRMSKIIQIREAKERMQAAYISYDNCVSDAGDKDGDNF